MRAARQKLLDHAHAKLPDTDALKTVLKGVFQETAETTGGLIGNKSRQ